MCDSRKALTRSQGGLGAGLALSKGPTFFFLLACATAGVAFHFTLVAITVQLVPVLGFWEGEVGERCSEDMPRSRWQSDHECAGQGPRHCCTPR